MEREICWCFLLECSHDSEKTWEHQHKLTGKCLESAAFDNILQQWSLLYENVFARSIMGSAQQEYDEVIILHTVSYATGFEFKIPTGFSIPTSWF